MTEMNNTIIVADDDAGTRLLLERLLRKEGYEVTSAQDGAEVLSIIKNQLPILFLLDIVMRTLDGFEVCQRLKRDELLKHIPIIFITSLDQTSDIVKGFRVGASDYITKPITKEEVLARVNAHVRSYRYMLELARFNELAMDASPSTGLPGNNSIAAKVTQALKEGWAASILYCDLDNFKPFNDKYGFGRGDEVIKFTAQLIKQAVQTICGPNAFIGHIGGDDFIVLAPADKAEAAARKIITLFDEKISDFYDPEDINAGKIVAKDRQGRPREFPILSISIGGLELQGRSFSHYQELANACAEVKEVAKAQPGSSVFFDRRQS